MQPFFDLTDDQIAFFEPLFGPYPLDQYGLAFTESPPGLAMETQGRSLFSRDDFPRGVGRFPQHLFLAHELAHQWFGDAVTPARVGRPLAQRVVRHIRPVAVARPRRAGTASRPGRASPWGPAGRHRADRRAHRRRTCSASSVTTVVRSCPRPAPRSVTTPSSPPCSAGSPRTTARRARPTTSSPWPSRGHRPRPDHVLRRLAVRADVPDDYPG